MSGARGEDGSISERVYRLLMLAYPKEPAAVLREAARATRGQIIVVQTLSAGVFGRTWHRMREFVWTIAAFHVSKLVGYVSPNAKFTMHTRRFYTAQALRREALAAGLARTTSGAPGIFPGCTRW